MPGLFTNIQKTKINTRTNGDFLNSKAGKYWLRIDSFKESRSDRKKMDQVFLNLTVIHIVSSDPQVQTPHQIGDAVSERMAEEYMEKNMKAFLAGFYGIDAKMVDEEIKPELAEWAIGNYSLDGKPFAIPGQPSPLIGSVVLADVRRIMLREAVVKGVLRPARLGNVLNWGKEVPPEEVLRTLDPAAIQRFFPGDFLQKQVAK